MAFSNTWKKQCGCTWMHKKQTCNHHWEMHYSSIHWEFVNDYLKFSRKRFGFVSCRRCNILSMITVFALHHYYKQFRKTHHHSCSFTFFFSTFLHLVIFLMLNNIFTMFSIFSRNFHKKSVLAPNIHTLGPLTELYGMMEKITSLFMFMVWRDSREIAK